MNLFFHTMFGAGIAPFLYSKTTIDSFNRVYIRGAVLGIFSHGVLDLLPGVRVFGNDTKDIVISIILYIIMIAFHRGAKNKLLTFWCIFGSWLPDIIDKMPRYLFHTKHYIFPFHWNSVINESYQILSLNGKIDIFSYGYVFTALVVLFCLLSLFANYKLINFKVLYSYFTKKASAKE